MKKIKIISLLISTIFILQIALGLASAYATETEENKDGLVAEGTPQNGTLLGADTDTSDTEWTDFSNAKFELKKQGKSKAIIEVSNVEPKEDSSYRLYLSSDSSKPNISSIITESNYSSEVMSLVYDKDSKLFKSVTANNGVDEVSKSVELNQDIYATVIEYSSRKENIDIYGVKLERYEEPKYFEALSSTFTSNIMTQISTNFTHAKVNNRKIKVKIGEIADTSVLQKIKNNDSDGFSNLLSYAKSSDSLYNKTLEANKDDSYAIEYTNSTGELSISGIKDKGYYYLYLELDDESGKYTPGEAVTLGIGYNNTNGWGINYYDTNEFEWVNFSTEGNIDTDKDPTVAPTPIPQTGQSIAIVVGIGFSIVAAYILVKKYKEYKQF